MTGIIAQNVGRTSGLIKAASGGGGGVWTKIKEITASSSSTISFVNGSSDVVLDSTYPIYRFSFINIHSSADQNFSFNMSTDTGSNYNVTKTSTAFEASHRENGTGGTLGYNTSRDLAQGTGFQVLSDQLSSSNNDANLCGSLSLYAPSSTTFVKHFIATTNFDDPNSPQYSFNYYIAGYGNTTSAVDAIQFKMASGNIDAGKIKLYGLKDSA